MKPVNKSIYKKRRGAALIISMIFVLIFSTLAVSMVSMSGVNLQIADNHHKVNSSLSAAESGLDCGRFIVANTPLPSTAINIVTVAEADQVWNSLCAQVQAQPWVAGEAQQTENEIITPAISFGADNASFQVRFHRDDTYTISLEGIGADGEVERQVSIEMNITKDNEVLNYAIASRGRMWLTGDTTIHGDIFSSWDRPEISPYNMTSDDPIGTNYEDRFYGPYDEVQAYHEGINYGQPYEDIPGMDISDYDTDGYNSGLTNLPSCPSEDKEIEYFPHALGNYNYPRDGTPYTTWNRKLTRHVYEDQTFSDVRLPDNYNALFRNCTFDNILYVDCYKSGSTKYNNVRFEDCSFNGVIVTDVPQVFKWQNNCLYFTGEAAFDNTSGMQEATILAPHFNVNLGNTNPEQNDNNVLTGAIVGGIVDVRGNAQIYGTIISMCDTTQWSSGYVTNIGATLDDGGSETTELGDIGVISITPEEDKMLPSGITSPIVIKPMQGTYSEGV